MPFSNIHNEEVYDSFPMEGKWRNVLAGVCVCVWDMWASHLQGHAERDSCVLCNFTVRGSWKAGIGPVNACVFTFKWVLVCRKRWNLFRMQLPVYAVVFICKNAECIYLLSTYASVFTWILSYMCGRSALLGTSCCSTSAAQNQTQPINGAWCILSGMAH